MPTWRDLLQEEMRQFGESIEDLLYPQNCNLDDTVDVDINAVFVTNKHYYVPHERKIRHGDMKRK